MEVRLEKVPGRQEEFIIKDSTGITVGRIFSVEINIENHFYILRIKLYKENDYEILRSALYRLMKGIFAAGGIYKVNIFVDQTIDTRSFIDLGFELEGVIEDTIWNNGHCRFELLFGITANRFNSNQIKNRVVLKGKNINLKLLLPSDADKTLDYYTRNKEHLRPYEPERDDSFYTMDVQKKILIESYKQYLNGSSINYGIFNVKDELIGKIQLSNIVTGIFKNAFVGYSMDIRYEGRGYMKEALKLVVNYAFENMKLHRIEASTLVDNNRSQNVLMSCGFKEIGISKKYLFIDGMWRDHKIFYCTKEFYKNL